MAILLQKITRIFQKKISQPLFQAAVKNGNHGKFWITELGVSQIIFRI